MQITLDLKKLYIAQVNSNKYCAVHTLLYLWHRMLLQSGNMVELDAAATRSEIPLSCPYFAGPRLL